MCCPRAEFIFLANGLQIIEKGLNSTESYQFFPYRAIQTTRYVYDRDEREGQISIWIQGNGTPGAGGLSFRWRFSCTEEGKSKYEQLLTYL